MAPSRRWAGWMLSQGKRSGQCCAHWLCWVSYSHNCTCAGRQHRYIYAALALSEAAENGPQQALGRLDVVTGQTESWTRGRQYFVGEPCFVARGAPCPCAAWA